MAFLACPRFYARDATHFFQEPLLIRFHNSFNFDFGLGYDDEVENEDNDDDSDAKVNC